MIEISDNILQLVVLVACFALSLLRYARCREDAWLLICCFYGCDLFALAYWLCYLVVFGITPRYFYVSELGWLASSVFMLALMAYFDAQRTPQPPILLAWVPVAFVIPQFALYVTHGDVLLNIATCSLMAAAGFFAMRGVCATGSKGVFAFDRPFHIAVLMWFVAQFAVWTTSCFWGGESFTPYIVSDLMLTASKAWVLVRAWEAAV